MEAMARDKTLTCGDGAFRRNLVLQGSFLISTRAHCFRMPFARLHESLMSRPPYAPPFHYPLSAGYSPTMVPSEPMA